MVKSTLIWRTSIKNTKYIFTSFIFCFRRSNAGKSRNLCTKYHLKIWFIQFSSIRIYVVINFRLNTFHLYGFCFESGSVRKKTLLWSIKFIIFIVVTLQRCLAIRMISILKFLVSALKTLQVWYFYGWWYYLELMLLLDDWYKDFIAWK